LPDPFFVLATQNPIEQEGTYPLPEAQQDRFMFKVFVRYPTFDEEFEIAKRTTGPNKAEIAPLLSAAEIVDLQELVLRTPVADAVVRYALTLVRQTRAGQPGVPDDVRHHLAWGAGPRAVQYLLLGAKARGLLYGRTHAGCEDVAALAKPVLRHRIAPNFAAKSQGIDADRIIGRLLDDTPMREDELSRDPRFAALLKS
ncbi:MAG: AAA family ATPase, partial [Planctomycetia bacterium]